MIPKLRLRLGFQTVCEYFVTLATQLRSIAGGFILSINDTPEVREAFAGFNFDQVETTYTVSAGPAKRVPELIIRPASR